ncbi:MAG: alanyl-tRNA synthetase [Myxococcota bacterium]|jgi:alanyl-tRNA synthetase
MKWTSDSIRQTFLDYYAEKGHRRMSSLQLIPPGDPTLLFTNAGMVQFKDIFTGQTKVDYDAACTSQKCLRVSGKHNDLDNVGRTARHHTFFEMLGNFSFGKYFKEGAIESAWTLLTTVYGLPTDNLWVTVHPDDDEARQIWTRVSGLPPERILDDPENFWSMGDTGPCGPCSEIHIDQGKGLSGGVEVPFGEGGDRYLEIWNLVFMQYDRDETGALTPLPTPCIDTGMGLERIAAILAGEQTNYNTDLFAPLIARTAALAGVRYGQDDETDVALRVIADHARAATFLIADGVYPENEGRGYVIRRVMRRAMRFGRKLGLRGSFLAAVCGEVVTRMKEAFPELADKAEVINTVVTQEEERFGRTLAAGLKRLEDAFGECAESKRLPGSVAFELYDTHGFPLDLTAQAADERGYTVDEAGFESAMAEQRAKGRASWKGAVTDTTAWETLRDEKGTTAFCGYDKDSGTGVVLAVVEDGTAVVADNTPFYAESGGQAGDTGVIRSGEAVFRVTDTRRPIDGVVVHRGSFESGSFAAGDTVTLAVDADLRDMTRKNHSATHLLHFALRNVLGDHVKQRGSMVGPHRLRFDFSHFGPLNPDETRQIEELVNSRVLQNDTVQTDLLAKDEAVARGAVAFFGDKYGEEVRMLTITSDSIELCGGTHVHATGDIGMFKISSDSSLAAGVRRVEAVTGMDALRYVQERDAMLSDIAGTLGVGAGEISTRIAKIQSDHKTVSDELKALKAKQRSAGLANLEPETVGDVSVLTVNLQGVKGGDLRDMADKARARIGSGVVLLTSVDGEKVALLIAVTDDLKKRFPAGKLVKELAPIVGGRGGGRPDLAQAGGNEPGRVADVVGALHQLIAQG